MQEAWLFKDTEDGEWEISFEEPPDWYAYIKHIAIVELKSEPKGPQA
jgi:hypothetical protein